MDRTASEYIDNVVKAIPTAFEQSEYEFDATPSRIILSVRCKYGPYQVFITELFSNAARKYRYYVLYQNQVVAGFDNAPDPRAIRMKYGTIGRDHTGEQIPHLHLENKKRIELTGELSFFDFVQWVKKNLSQTIDPCGGEPAVFPSRGSGNPAG